MILSRACKYGLQAVIYLARQEDRSPVLSKRIAEDLDIPQYYLAKILHDLSRQGLLKSFRGRRGGFKLARSADSIRPLEVVEAIEGRGFCDGCVLGILPECPERAACVVHSQWSAIKSQIIAMLGEKSVRELIEESRPSPGS